VLCRPIAIDIEKCEGMCQYTLKFHKYDKIISICRITIFSLISSWFCCTITKCKNRKHVSQKIYLKECCHIWSYIQNNKIKIRLKFQFSLSKLGKILANLLWIFSFTIQKSQLWHYFDIFLHKHIFWFK